MAVVGPVLDAKDAVIARQRDAAEPSRRVPPA